MRHLAAWLAATVLVLQASTVPAAPPASAPVAEGQVTLEARLRALPETTPAGPFVTSDDGAIVGVHVDSAVVSRDRRAELAALSDVRAGRV